MGFWDFERSRTALQKVSWRRTSAVGTLRMVHWARRGDKGPEEKTRVEVT